jgi:hypothetical protein
MSYSVVPSGTGNVNPYDRGGLVLVCIVQVGCLLILVIPIADDAVLAADLTLELVKLSVDWLGSVDSYLNHT